MRSRRTLVRLGVATMLALATTGARPAAAIELVGSFNPGIGGLSAVAYDDVSGNVFVYPIFGSEISEYTPDGTLVDTIPVPGDVSDEIDLDFATSPVDVAGTIVPTNTLLVLNDEAGDGAFFALDKNDGSILASTTYPAAPGGQSVGASFLDSSNSLFTVDWIQDTVVEIDTFDGSALSSFSVVPGGAPPFDIFFGDLDVSQADDRLLLVSSTQNILRVLESDGSLVVDVDYGVLGVSGLSGAAFDDATGELRVSSTTGLVFQLADVFNPIPEPSTALLTAAGLCVLAGRGRR